jgi:hypothetical protein
MKEIAQMNARTGAAPARPGAKMVIAGLIGSAALAAPVTAAVTGGQIANAQAGTATDANRAVLPAVTTAFTFAQLPGGSVQAAQPAIAQPQAAQAFFSQLTHDPQAGSLPNDSQVTVNAPGVFQALFAPSPENPAAGSQVASGTVQLAGLPDPGNPLAPSVAPAPLPDSSLPLNVLPHPGVLGGFGIIKDSNGMDVLQFTPFDGSAPTVYQPGDAVTLPDGASAIRATTDSQGNSIFKIDQLPLPSPQNFLYRGAGNDVSPSDPPLIQSADSSQAIVTAGAGNEVPPTGPPLVQSADAGPMTGFDPTLDG